MRVMWLREVYRTVNPTGMRAIALVLLQTWAANYSPYRHNRRERSNTKLKSLHHLKFRRIHPCYWCKSILRSSAHNLWITIMTILRGKLRLSRMKLSKYKPSCFLIYKYNILFAIVQISLIFVVYIMKIY